jgi:hypothetical protein
MNPSYKIYVTSDFSGEKIKCQKDAKEAELKLALAGKRGDNYGHR